jgi:hypothetical protein
MESYLPEIQLIISLLVDNPADVLSQTENIFNIFNTIF